MVSLLIETFYEMEKTPHLLLLELLLMKVLSIVFSVYNIHSMYNTIPATKRIFFIDKKTYTLNTKQCDCIVNSNSTGKHTYFFIQEVNNIIGLKNMLSTCKSIIMHN